MSVLVKLEEGLGLSPIWPDLTKKSCKAEYNARKRRRDIYNTVDAMYQGYHTADIDVMTRWAELYGISIEEEDTASMVRERISASQRGGKL